MNIYLISNKENKFNIYFFIKNNEIQKLTNNEYCEFMCKMNKVEESYSTYTKKIDNIRHIFFKINFQNKLKEKMLKNFILTYIRVIRQDKDQYNCYDSKNIFNKLNQFLKDDILREIGFNLAEMKY